MNVDPGALESAFGPAGAAQGGAEGKRVRITVVAPRLDELPDARAKSFYYGPSPLDWKPYLPESDRPIADVAAEVARSLTYRAEVGDPSEHEGALLSGDARSGPQILVIDPWALEVPDSQQLLQRLNSGHMPWAQTIIVWNAADEESRKAEGKLRASLDATLRRKLDEATSTSLLAARGVPTLEDFDAVLRQLIAWVANRYLGHAVAHPPVGQLVERPRIS
jgi:FxsC-like protein